MRKILVIDSGRPCNAQTPHSHNFLTQDGKTPAEIASVSRQQVAAYDSVSFMDAVVVSGRKLADSFEIRTDNGTKFIARKLIFATGVKDIMPDIKGFTDCWGISVIHCPYCHGYEFAGKATGIFAPAEKGFHLAMLGSNLTKNLLVFTDGCGYSSEQLAELKNHDIPTFNAKITEAVHENGNLSQVILADGQTVKLDALYAGVSFEQHCRVPMDLGCAVNEQGYLLVDLMFKTPVDGIWACGDNVSPMRSVANAVAGGNMAGAVVNRELCLEEWGSHA